MHFLQELVQDYLILAHPEVELPRIEMADEATPGEKEEDRQIFRRLSMQRKLHMEIKKRYPPESPLLWSFHHCFTDSNDAVFYSGRDSKESAETTGSIDDSGESEKLFSVSVYDKFLWMD